MSQVSKYAGVLGWDYTTHVAFRKLGVKSHLIDGIVYWGVLAAPETMFHNGDTLSAEYVTISKGKYSVSAASISHQ